MNIEYIIGAVGLIVTVIAGVGVYSYYEIERIAQQEKAAKGQK